MNSKLGILGNNARSYIRLNETTGFNKKALANSKMTLDDNTQVAIKDLEQEEQSDAYATLETASNAIYQMLNGTTRPDISIKKFASNALTTGTFTSIFTPTVEVFMLDYIRPRLVLSNLLATTIPVGPDLNKGVISMLRQFGMIKISEVAKDGDYPIVSPNLGEYTEQMALSSRKYGVKLEIEKELLNSDQFGILGFLMTGIADGFRFRKELETLKVINGVGEVLYDNLNPVNGVFGTHTGGRAIDSSFNGTVTMEDIQRMAGYAMMRGVTPQYLLMHPFGIFNMLGDSELRNMIDGAASTLLPPMPDSIGFGHPFGEDLGMLLRYTGSAGVGTGTGVVNPSGPLAGKVTIGGFGPVGDGPLGLPGLDPYSNMPASTNQHFVGRANIPGMNIQIVTSPQVPIKSYSLGGANKLVTNMYLIGDKKPVAILQEANPGILEWDNIEHEMSYMAFREKYSVIPLHQGRGVYTIKGLVIDKNYALNIRHSVNIGGPGSIGEPSGNPVVV